LNKTLDLLQAEGMEATLRYCAAYLQYRLLGRRMLSVEDILYQRWRKEHAASPEQMQAMRASVSRLSFKPLISVVMPVYNVDARLLQKAIGSVERQIYPRWELCIADDSSTNAATRAVLERYAGADKKIKMRFLERNQGIAGASNAALALAEGEFVALLDHDDQLAPVALFEVVKLLNEHPDADFIYSDEDKIDERGRHVEAFLKPDWSPELLLSTMYTCHLGVYRRSIVEEIGGFRAGFDGAQDFDLALRLTERTDRIHHIPKVLYHWRRSSGSTAISYHSSAGGKTAAASSIKALHDALERRGVSGTVEQGRCAGTYRVRAAFPSDSLVSIIIPTRDRSEYLKTCIDSIFRLTKRPRFEIIIADNESSEPRTKEYFASLEGDSRVRIIDCPGDFNYSAINNATAARAEGNALLFLNNDTEVIEAGWLEAMLEMLELPGVAIVGAKLLYPDDTVQHAGIALWHCGTAAHVHSRLPREEPGYFCMADVIRNCSAVSGACMMVKRSVFESLGGFDSAYKVSYQDVDLCLRAAEAGFRTVFTPFALLYHHESASTGKRGDEHEELLFFERWKKKRPFDPYYNSNFPATRADFRLARA